MLHVLTFKIKKIIIIIKICIMKNVDIGFIVLIKKRIRTTQPITTTSRLSTWFMYRIVLYSV
jgi:hypothetical protein